MKILVRKAVVKKKYKVDFFFFFRIQGDMQLGNSRTRNLIFSLYRYLCATPAESNLFEKETEIQWE